MADRYGEPLALGNTERGEITLTPNEDDTLEVYVDNTDGRGVDSDAVMLLARSEARRLYAWLGKELGL